MSPLEPTPLLLYRDPFLLRFWLSFPETGPPHLTPVLFSRMTWVPVISFYQFFAVEKRPYVAPWTFSLIGPRLSFPGLVSFFYSGPWIGRLFALLPVVSIISRRISVSLP